MEGFKPQKPNHEDGRFGKVLRAAALGLGLASGGGVANAEGESAVHVPVEENNAVGVLQEKNDKGGIKLPEGVVMRTPDAITPITPEAAPRPVSPEAAFTPVPRVPDAVTPIKPDAAEAPVARQPDAVIARTPEPAETPVPRKPDDVTPLKPGDPIRY